jgi:hypothetical protein
MGDRVIPQGLIFCLAGIRLMMLAQVSLGKEGRR